MSWLKGLFGGGDKQPVESREAREAREKAEREKSMAQESATRRCNSHK